MPNEGNHRNIENEVPGDLSNMVCKGAKGFKTMYGTTVSTLRLWANDRHIKHVKTRRGKQLGFHD